MRRIRWPIWLGALLCLFFAMLSGTAEAHGTAVTAPATDQPAISANGMAADQHSCPDGLQHDHNRCCSGHGLCHAAALIQNATAAAIAQRQSPTPTALPERAGGDVAPPFHPPKSQHRS